MPTPFRVSVSLALLLALAAPAARAGEAAHPRSEDLVQLRAPGDLRLSPDGTRAVFTLASASFDSAATPKDGDTKGGWTRERPLWVVDLTTRASRALTTGEALVSSPAFAPDGRSVLFVRARDGAAKLQSLPLDGGEARVIATGALEPGSPAYSPDGRWIAFLAESPASDSTKRARWARGGAEHWEHEWTDTRLWVVPAEGGEPRALTTGTNVTGFRWAPDSKRFALLTSADADPYKASGLLTVRVIDTQGRELRTLSREPSAYDAFEWAPDGHSLALVGLDGGLSNPNALLLWDVEGGAVRPLTTDPDHTFGGIQWSADGRALFAVWKARTETKLVRWPLAGAPAVLPFTGRVITSEPLRDAAGRRLVFLSGTNDTPDEVTTFDPATGRTTVATDLNPQVAGWRRGRTEVVRWTDAEGVALEGLLTVSPDSRPGAPAPLMVMPHGGPDDVTEQRFSALTQYFASRGYSVFRPNYRGSLGYGFALYAANRNRFGEVEQADIESGVDALIAAGKADPAKLYFGGWSWGGYITSWMVGHVHRYVAAVAGAAVSDVYVQYSLSDINHGISSQWEFEGDPWRQPEHFDRVNPIRYAKDVTTPLLLLHGEADTRVGFPASVEMYRALSDLGREVEFWAYPREDHGFAEPAHRVDYVRRWADWYDAHPPKGTGTPRP